MLQKISDRIQGWIAGLIVAVVAAVFSLWGIEYYINQGGEGSRVVATVGSQKITEKDLSSAFQNILRRVQASRPNQPMTADEQGELKSVALEQLVSQAALLHAAEYEGLSIAKTQVEQFVLQIPAFQLNGLFSPQRFQQFLLASQVNESQFIKQVRDDLLIDQVQKGITESAFATPSEVKVNFSLLKQRRDFGYSILPLDQFISKVSVGDSAIKSYYDANQTAYKTKDRVKVSYLLLKPESIMNRIQVSEQELKQYYTQNEASFVIPKQWQVLRIALAVKGSENEVNAQAKQQLQQVRQQIESGVSVDALTKSSSVQITKLAYTESTLPSELSQTVKTLKLGQFSQPVKNGDDLVMIRLLSVTPKVVKSFSETKSEIKQRMTRQQVQQILSQKSDELANLTYTNPSSLAPAAKQLNLAVQETDWLTQQGNKQGIFSNPKIMSTVFSGEVLKERNNSSPIDLKDGSVIVLRVNQYQPSKVKPLSEVAPEIKRMLVKNAAEKEAGIVAYRMIESIKAGKNPEQVARENGFIWQIKQSILRDNRLILHPIVEAAFKTPVKNKQDQSGIDSLVLSNGNYVVLQVTSVKQGSLKNASEKDLKLVADRTERLNGELDYFYYKQSVMDNIKIKLTPSK